MGESSFNVSSLHLLKLHFSFQILFSFVSLACAYQYLELLDNSGLLFPIPSSPLKVKEDDEVDNLEIKLNVKRKSKRVYQSPPPEVNLKISRSLKVSFLLQPYPTCCMMK